MLSFPIRTKVVCYVKMFTSFSCAICTFNVYWTRGIDPTTNINFVLANIYTSPSIMLHMLYKTCACIIKSSVTKGGNHNMKYEISMKIQLYVHL